MKLIRGKWSNSGLYNRIHKENTVFIDLDFSNKDDYMIKWHFLIFRGMVEFRKEFFRIVGISLIVFLSFLMNSRKENISIETPRVYV